MSSAALLPVKNKLDGPNPSQNDSLVDDLSNVAALSESFKASGSEEDGELADALDSEGTCSVVGYQARAHRGL